MPGFGAPPRVVQHFISAGIYVTGDQRVKGFLSCHLLSLI